MKNKKFLVWILLLFLCCLTGCSFAKNPERNKELKRNTEIGSEQIPGAESLEEETEAFLTSEKTEEEILQEKVTEYLDKMTLEEKAAQLFIVLPEALMEGVSSVTAAGTATQETIDQIPVGGFIYMENNLQSSGQVKSMLENVQKFSKERIGFPMFLCVDEEGGAVARIAGTGKFDVPAVESMAEVGLRQNADEAYGIGETIGGYLSNLGFNVDFAPVADVWTNPQNQVVKKRSFGSDADVVSDMANAAAEGLMSQGILSCLKHFPGHGNTTADTHAGYAYTDKTKEELYECELIPFLKGIKNDVPFIMVGHISLPNVTGDDTPASLSPVIMQELLRKEMGYEGMIITDAFNMGAIANQYSSGEAAVKALQAGADILLMPKDFQSAYEEVVLAMKDGRLPVERIDESLRRILTKKLELDSK